MPSYPSDANDTVVYNGVDLYVPKDCSVTVFDDSRVFLFGEWYLNGQPLMSGSAAISGAEVSVSTVQPTDPGITLWFDTSAGYGELKVLVGGSWITVEDPADAAAANEVSIGVGQPVPANYELWVDTSVSPENLKAKVSGSWKSINSEVAIGGVEPTDPAIELWVDTASAAPSFPDNYISPGNALGIVAIGSFITSGNISVSPVANVKITNPLVFTSIVGRRYELVFQLHAIGTLTPGGVNFLINGAPFGPADSFDVAQVSQYGGVNFSAKFDGTGASHSFQIGMTFTGGDIPIWCDGISTFHIRDVGPNVSPALPIPATAPAWTPLAFTNGWSQRAGEQVAAYRKIGDVVSIKGSITRGTALVAPIYSPCAILPAGFRPPAPMKMWAMFAADGNGGPGLLSVEPDGQIKVAATSANAPNPHLMTQFEGSFSVTP